VVDEHGLPVDAAVTIGTSTAATDATGSFTIGGVTVPYDLVALVNPNVFKIAIIYEGLTRADPTITAVQLRQNPPNRVTVSGNVPPGHPNDVTYVTFSIPNLVSPITGIATDPTTGDFSVDVTWRGTAQSTTLTVNALRWTKSAGNLPTAYLGWAELPNIPISNGSPKPNVNLALTQLSGAKAISGHVTVQPGYSVAQNTITIKFGSGGKMTVANDFAPPAAGVPFSYITPPVPGATAELTVEAQNAAASATATATRTGLQLDATSIAVGVEAAPKPTLPVNNATGVTYATPFDWTSFVGGVNMLDVEPNGAGPEFHIVTSRATTNVPDLSLEGMGLPAATNYRWFLNGFGPFASVDEAAGPAGLPSPPTARGQTLFFKTK
jgi:hypothetical protein